MTKEQKLEHLEKRFKRALEYVEDTNIDFEERYKHADKFLEITHELERLRNELNVPKNKKCSDD